MKEPLLLLAPSDLRSIAFGLKTGRLSPPYSETKLQRFLSDGFCAEVSIALNEFAGVGMPASGIARALELVAASRADRPPLEDLVDLVTTGPEAGGVTNRDTSVVVRDLFCTAEESVLVAGYAVYQGQKVFESLAERMAERPELKVRMYLDIQRGRGDTTSAGDLERRFAHRFRGTQWPIGKPLPEVYYDPRSLAFERGKCAALHAKCIVVDRRAVSFRRRTLQRRHRREISKSGSYFIPVSSRRGSAAFSAALRRLAY